MFKKANELKVYPKIGVCGPSGSGKTLSSLLIAYGYTNDWDKICVIDTENSGMYYANRFLPHLNKQIGNYSYASIKPPFTLPVYMACIEEAIKYGFEAIIVDSLSHLWTGQGGFLEQVEQSGKSFNAWAKVTPEYNKLIDFINRVPACLICTFRAKTDYAQEKDSNGRTVIKQIGLAPVFRDQIDYEFMFWFNINRDHVIEGRKDRCGLFPNAYMLDEEIGKKLKQWSTGQLKEETSFSINTQHTTPVGTKNIDNNTQNFNNEPKQQQLSNNTSQNTQESDQQNQKQDKVTKNNVSYATLKQKLKNIGISTPQEIQGWITANLNKNINSPKDLTSEDLETLLVIVCANEKKNDNLEHEYPF